MLEINQESLLTEERSTQERSGDIGNPEVMLSGVAWTEGDWKGTATVCIDRGPICSNQVGGSGTRPIRGSGRINAFICAGIDEEVPPGRVLEDGNRGRRSFGRRRRSWKRKAGRCH